MTETIRRAVIQAISTAFPFPVYGQTVPQGGKRPCFTVELTKTEEKRLLGRRGSMTVFFSIGYYHGRGGETAAEEQTAAEGLSAALRLIGEKEKFAAGVMERRKTTDGLQMTVSYGFHILWDEEETLMQRLEHNGRRAAGYHE